MALQGNPGPLTFNKSTAPFEPLKDYVSYLRGLDHAGGWSLGGHSSGDVFATGADMTEPREDQQHLDRSGRRERPRAQDPVRRRWCWGRREAPAPTDRSKTLSHRGPGRPIPSLHKPQEIFNRLFDPYAGKGIEQVRAGLKREGQHSST